MIPAEICVRPMQVEDIPEVHAIDVLSFSLPWSERSYRFEVTENTASSPWVAEAHFTDGSRRIVGMMVNWIILDEVHIATIAVHPDYRRMGIARLLLDKGLREAFERGARMAFLEVRRSNTAAQKLYESFGFRVEGVRPKYYQDNQEDALLMTLNPLDETTLQHLADPSEQNSTGGERCNPIKS
ncbi:MULTISPECIES: ribosomal protein S18-alanine N-acetyltransferase [Anaerolinea]|uniref:ribosomal protein S18-alanine N-acetyltransferase n=1 Tax=Anaerolinea TaxID=233189 RepID=UPI00261BE5BF|nr:ribosomal protein S18-alanine N-acetyltransferase [Anaerolinea thermophila]